MRRLAEFFHEKGLDQLKAEDRDETWYADWIEYQGRHGLYAAILTPEAAANGGACGLDLLRLSRFWEAAAYFSPAHAYSLHVTFLGLYPLLRGANEGLRRDAIASLAGGGVFAFGVSERGHGADLLGNEFTVTRAGPGQLSATGSKYYIGNANVAEMVTVLAKRGRRGDDGGTRRAPFLLFALRPRRAGAVRSMRKIRTSGIRAAYVAAFDVDGHAFPESDVVCEGRAAWETVLATVTLGKLFLCFGSIGCCEHALVEAVAHLDARILYGKPVSAMPHIRSAMAHAYARLTGMKLFAYRALDYLHAAHADDRRFVLFAAVQKATVSSEAVRVVALLSECVGARGFESETFIENALRDAPLVPVLEGSTHLNHQTVARFLGAYFARGHERGPTAAPVPPPGEVPSLSAPGARAGENPYLWELLAGDEDSVRFPHCLGAYRPWRTVPNVRVFVRQVRAFRRFAADAAGTRERDLEVNVAIGKCLSVVVYAQLVAEHAAIAGVPTAMLSVIFHQLIETLSVEALRLASLPKIDARARGLLARTVAIPRTEQADIEFVASCKAL